MTSRDRFEGYGDPLLRELQERPADYLRRLRDRDRVYEEHFYEWVIASDRQLLDLRLWDLHDSPDELDSAVGLGITKFLSMLRPTATAQGEATGDSSDEPVHQEGMSGTASSGEGPIVRHDAVPGSGGAADELGALELEALDPGVEGLDNGDTRVGQIDTSANWQGRLYITIYRTAVDALRRWRRWKLGVEAATEEAATEAGVERTSSTEELSVVSSLDLQQLLKDAKLSVEEKRILFLRIIHECSRREVAEHLNISEGKVRRIEHKALKKLRDAKNKTQ